MLVASAYMLDEALVELNIFFSERSFIIYRNTECYLSKYASVAVRDV